MEKEPYSAEPPEQIYENVSRAFRAEADALSTDEEVFMATKAIETMNTPLYAAIAQFETSSESVAREVHTRVRHEGMRILFLDRAHEVNDERSRQRADEYLKKVLSELLPAQQHRLMQLEKKLFVFWDIEKQMRERMFTGASVSDDELREFVLRKSTDVFLYATITRFSVPISREVMLEFYMHQLLRDVDDDIRDLEEDAHEQMPNPFLLKLWQKGAYDVHRSYDQKQLESLIMETGVVEEHTAFVTQYCQTLSSRLPDPYRWMRRCAGTARLNPSSTPENARTHGRHARR